MNKKCKGTRIDIWRGADEKTWERDSDDTREYHRKCKNCHIFPRYIPSHIPSSDTDEEELWDKRHPSWTDKWIVGDEYEVSDDVDNCDNSIDPYHFPLFSTSDERIGEKGWDKIKKEYPCDNTHSIFCCIGKKWSFHEFSSWDKCEYLTTKYHEKDGKSKPKGKENLEGIWDDSFGLIFFPLLDTHGQNRKNRVEEYCPVHHAHFDNLHRKGIECDCYIGNMSFLHNREKDSIYLEKYCPEKECQSVGKWEYENLLDIGTIPCKSHSDILSRIPPGEEKHEKIARESCDHHKGISPCFRYSWCYRKEYTRK